MHRHRAVRLGLAFVLAASALSGGAEEGALTVHEWGTFTTVAGVDGAALDWRPLAWQSDLPSFVHDASRDGKGLRAGPPRKFATAQARMETPVRYFYADRETEVSVRVEFPKGKVTEWSPLGKGGRRVHRLGAHQGPSRHRRPPPPGGCGEPLLSCPRDGRRPRACLRPRPGCGAERKVPVLPGDRKPGAAAQGRSGGGLRAPERGRRRGHPLGHRLRAEGLLGRLEGEATAPRPAGSGAPWEERIVPDLTGFLVRQGLYEKEAAAMVKTWRRDWFEEGLRVFYALPRPATDAILPLRIAPRPAEVVRVMVGRVELLTPEFERGIEAEAAGLAEASFERRERASEALLKRGRFAEPVLRRLLDATQDAEVRARLRALLGEGVR